MLANDELCKSNMVLQNTINNMQRAMNDSKRNLKFLCDQNDIVKGQLEKERSSRKNCNQCLSIQDIMANDDDANEELIDVVNLAEGVKSE